MFKLKAFFTYFGGKHTLVEKYPDPKWSTIVECFAGSAGYSTRFYNRKVMLYDVNPRVFGTWDYLIKSSPSDIMALPIDFEDVRELTVCQEAKWLIGWWLGAGNFEPRNRKTPWSKLPGKERQSWGEAIRLRLARQSALIKHWKVFNEGYDSAPDIKATWFIDPPYQRSGTRYTFHSLNYTFLSHWFKRRKGQIICCGQDGDNWANFTHLYTSAAITNTGGGARTTKEMIYTND